MRQQLMAQGDDVRASIEAAAAGIRALAAAGGAPETPAPAQVIKPNNLDWMFRV